MSDGDIVTMDRRSDDLPAAELLRREEGRGTSEYLELTCLIRLEAASAAARFAVLLGRCGASLRRPATATFKLRSWCYGVKNPVTM
jgi:hypothetical protein